MRDPCPKCKTILFGTGSFCPWCGCQVAPRAADAEKQVTLTFHQAARGVTLPLQIDSDEEPETIQIKYPAGVTDGSRIRIKRRGRRHNDARGDLYVIIAVEPHPYFRRDKMDIYLDLPLSIYEAILGTELKVPTLDGPVTLTVPPGTGRGAKLHINGHGVERAGKKGDLIVVTQVEVPKNVDPKASALIRELSKQCPIAARANVLW
jgi:DnaJ-class molecular chaperone